MEITPNENAGQRRLHALCLEKAQSTLVDHLQQSRLIERSSITRDSERLIAVAEFDGRRFALSPIKLRRSKSVSQTQCEAGLTLALWP